MAYCEENIPFLNTHDMVHFSFDLGPAALKVETEDYYYVACSPVLDDDQLSALIAERLQLIKSSFRGRVLVENLNYFPTSAYDRVCDAGFIKEVVVENDIYLLLDIGSALVSAYNFGIEPWDYFRAMPLDRVAEIHLTAPGQVDGKWRDLHNVPTETEFQLLDKILDRVPFPPYLVIEYYREFAQIVAAYKTVADRYSKIIK